MSTEAPQTKVPIAESRDRDALILIEGVARSISRRAYSPRIKMLDIEQVEEATGLGKSTIYEMIKSEKFPKPQRNIGKNLWRESAIIAWADRNDPNRE